MITEKIKVQKPDIAKRSLDYAVRMIKLYQILVKDRVGKVIGNQILRSGTSIGANIHEAQGGQSKADFIAKISISHKESRETLYWLCLIERAEIIPTNRLVVIKDETNQIIKILSSILITAKQRK